MLQYGVVYYQTPACFRKAGLLMAMIDFPLNVLNIVLTEFNAVPLKCGRKADAMLLK